jgi:hypothetical protein
MPNRRDRRPGSAIFAVPVATGADLRQPISLSMQIGIIVFFSETTYQHDCGCTANGHHPRLRASPDVNFSPQWHQEHQGKGKRQKSNAGGQPRVEGSTGHHFSLFPVFLCVLCGSTFSEMPASQSVPFR